MIPLGLTPTELRAFEDALVDPLVQTRTRLTVFDSDDDPVKSLDAVFLGGDVTCEKGTPAKLRVVLADPHGDIPYDLKLDEAVSLKTLIGVTYGVKVGDTWRDVPVFRGPVRRYSRSGPEVSIEAAGKETLAMEPRRLGTKLEWNGSKPVSSAIKELFQAIGEREFALDRTTKQIGESRTVGRLAVPWDEALLLAKETDRQLFYDGRGRLRLRKLPKFPVYTFDHPIGAVSVAYDDTDFRNVVRVRWQGGHVDARPSKGHPLSPESLSRNGKNRELWEVVETSLKKESQARDRAQALLRTRLAGIKVEAEFDHLPVPHLEVGDECRVSHPDYGNVRFTLARFVLPLQAGGAMHVGHKKPIRYKAKRLKVREYRKPREEATA